MMIKFYQRQDLIMNVTPTSNNDWFATNMIEWFWRTGMDGISFANTVISRLPHLTDIDETTKQQMLSRAYFSACLALLSFDISVWGSSILEQRSFGS